MKINGYTITPAMKKQARVRSIAAVKRSLAADTLGATSGKHVSCAYSVGKRTCVVGAMFTPEQLQDIKRRRLNSENIEGLAERIGEHNVVAQTGFSLNELADLQYWHDRAYTFMPFGPASMGEFEKKVNDLK